MTPPQKLTSFTIKEGSVSDAESCGRLISDTFAEVYQKYGVPREKVPLEKTIERAKRFLTDSKVEALLAEENGGVVGSLFLDKRCEIWGIGPVNVASSHQGKGIGRRLMGEALRRAGKARGVRLLQDAFNVASLGLYLELGFEVKSTLVEFRGQVEGSPSRGVELRPLATSDREGVARLSHRVMGFDRSFEVEDALSFGQPIGVFKNGELKAYATFPSSLLDNHGVAESEVWMMELILAMQKLSGPLSFLFPMEQASLIEWCLKSGLTIGKVMTYLTRGDYQRPEQPWFPSVLR